MTKDGRTIGGSIVLAFFMWTTLHSGSAWGQGLSSNDVLNDLMQWQNNNTSLRQDLYTKQAAASNKLSEVLTAVGERAGAEKELASELFEMSVSLALLWAAPAKAGQFESVKGTIESGIGLAVNLSNAIDSNEAAKRLLSEYVSMQRDVMDMGQRLDASWADYEAIVDQARQVGILGANTYDPASGRWTIASPERSKTIAEPAPAKTPVFQSIGAWSMNVTTDGRLLATIDATADLGSMDQGEFSKLSLVCARDGRLKLSFNTYDGASHAIVYLSRTQMAAGTR